MMSYYLGISLLTDSVNNRSNKYFKLVSDVECMHHCMHLLCGKVVLIGNCHAIDVQYSLMF